MKKNYVFYNLKKARRINDYTCDDMAKFLNISLSYYSQIENGTRKLDYEMAVKISSIFNLQPDDIFYRYYEKSRIKPVRPKELKAISYFAEDFKKEDYK